MKTIKFFWAIVVIGLLAGCAVIDFDHSTNFNQYKTFGWGKSDRSSLSDIYKSELLDATIKSTITTEFKKKGLKYSSKKPDVLISYQASTQEKVAHTGSSYYYPSFSFWYFQSPWPVMGWPGWYWNSNRADYSYREGTLIINMVDRKTGKHIWRGMIQGSVDNLQSLNKTVSKGIKLIIKKYPNEYNGKPSMIPVPKDDIS